MIRLRIGKKKLKLDPIATLVDFQRLETAERIKDRQPTAELLFAICGWLRAKGIEQPTLAVAWQVWKLVWEYVDRVARKQQANADIAYWYGLNPFRLRTRQRLALWANLGRVQAQHQLANGRFSATDYRGVYNLVLLATGDKELAQRAQTEALERYVEASYTK